MQPKFLTASFFVGAFCLVSNASGGLWAQDKVRIGYIGLSLSSMPLLAARDLGLFAKNGIQEELLMLTFQLSSVALNAGDLEYVAGVGPGSVSATGGGSGRGVDRRQSADLQCYRAARGENASRASRQEDRVSGLGVTTHTAFTMAVEKAGANPKDFIVVGLGPQQQGVLESKSIEAVIVDPPVLFVLLKKGFSKVLDIGAAVGNAGGRTNDADQDSGR